MANSNKDTSTLGVYSNGSDGNQRLVHRYQGSDYGLEQIVEYFELGSVESAEPEGHTVVILSATEMKQLKTMADAYSFDYDEGFMRCAWRCNASSLSCQAIVFGSLLIFDQYRQSTELDNLTFVSRVRKQILRHRCMQVKSLQLR